MGDRQVVESDRGRTLERQVRGRPEKGGSQLCRGTLEEAREERRGNEKPQRVMRAGIAMAERGTWKSWAAAEGRTSRGKIKVKRGGRSVRLLHQNWQANVAGGK